MNAGESARPSGFSRRGISTPALLMSLMAAVLFVVLAVNLAQLSLQRRQMQQGIDAASIAGAAEIMDQRWLYLGPRSGGQSPHEIDERMAAVARQQVLLARQAAVNFAGLNDVAGKPISLGDEDIVLGWVDDPAQRDLPMQSHSPDGALNAVAIRGTRSKAGGNPPLLWMAQQTGLEQIDLVVDSQAVVDSRILGFRPLGHVNIPLMPLAVLPTLQDLQQPAPAEAPVNLWWARGEQDEFAVDCRRHEIRLGGDGIAEITFRLLGPGNGNGNENGNGEGQSPRRGAVVAFAEHQLSPEHFEQFAAIGINAQALANYGGQLTTSDDNPALLPGQFRFSPAELNRIGDALMRRQAQPRIWPIGADVSTALGRPGVGVVGFVAGSVVECRTEDGDLLIVVQPCVLQTPTALTDAAALRNPFIGKLLLSR